MCNELFYRHKSDVELRQLRDKAEMYLHRAERIKEIVKSGRGEQVGEMGGA